MTITEVQALSDQDLRIKVAELLGWQGPFRWGSVNLHGFPKGFKVPADAAADNATRYWYEQDHVPDYPASLEAMALATESFRGTQHWEFETILKEQMKLPYWWNASARQRAEALVLVMQKREVKS